MANFTVSENYGTYKGNASYILDGDTSNCWQANDSNTQGKYVLITSDETIKVNTVKYITTNSSEVFKSGTYLQYSTDGSNFTDVGQFNGATSVTFTVNVSCKYIRIYCKSGSGYVSISEITIDYDIGTDPVTPDDPTGDGTFTGSPTASSYTGLSSGSNYVKNAVEKTAENPATGSTNWYGSNNATVDSQYAEYTFDISSIPSNATNIKVSCKVAGKAESSTYSHKAGGKYSVWGLCCNGTAKGSQIYTTNTSSTVIEFTDTGTWTREELDGLQLRHYVGYYGSTTFGATLTIIYDTPGSGETSKLYIRLSNRYIAVEKIFKKINGVYQEIEVPDFDKEGHYIIDGTYNVDMYDDIPVPSQDPVTPPIIPE